MRVFIAGATGVLGRRLVARFVESGHAVVGVVRDAAGEDLVASLGGQGRRADLFDADALARASEGCDVFVHAATAIPRTARPTPADWELNDKIRRDGTRALTTAAARVGAKRYVQQSVIGVARPSDGSAFDEDSPPHPDTLFRSALDGEHIASDAGAQSGFSVAILRCGWFYGADAAHTRSLAAALRKRALPIAGRGDAVWAILHVDDAARAFLAAAQAGQTGLWHVVDDCPVSVRDLLTYFAWRLGARPPRFVPAWLMRLLGGSVALDFFTRSSRTSNARIRRDLGWTPRFPTYREGVDEIVARWDAERFTG